MVLKEEQAKLFYRLWIPLLDYVNRKYQLFPKLYGMDTPEGLPMEEVNHISSRLWDDTKIIDDYLASERYMGMEENAEILRQWMNPVRGKFIVDRHLQKGSVLISVENEEVYIVKGIYSSWREMLSNMPLPHIVTVTLIPFQGVIIYDGTLLTNGVTLGKNLSDHCKEVYRNAKKEGRLHFEL